MDVTTTPVSIGYGDSIVQNLGTTSVYIGEATLSSTTGVRISAGEAVAVAASNVLLYVVSASGTNDVRVLPRGRGIFPATVA